MEIKRRIGLLGGAFNPIHNGHLILADYAKNELKLDEVVFIPCYKSAYKNKTIQAYPNDRLAMLIKALPEEFGYDSSELRKKEISYTIDTIRFLVEIFDKDELVLIAGADTIDTFDSWKDSGEIKKLVEVKFAVKDFYVPEIGISSTLIRCLVKEGRSIKYLVPEAVEDYIIKNKLYKN